MLLRAKERSSYIQTPFIYIEKNPRGPSNIEMPREAKERSSDIQFPSVLFSKCYVLTEKSDISTTCMFLGNVRDFLVCG